MEPLRPFSIALCTNFIMDGLQLVIWIWIEILKIVSLAVYLHILFILTHTNLSFKNTLPHYCTDSAWACSWFYWINCNRIKTPWSTKTRESLFTFQLSNADLTSIWRIFFWQRYFNFFLCKFKIISNFTHLNVRKFL